MGGLKSAADPHGWFKKTLGILFLVVGIGILTGYDKKLEIWVLDQGWNGVTQIEQQLVDKKSSSLGE